MARLVRVAFCVFAGASMWAALKSGNGWLALLIVYQSLVVASGLRGEADAPHEH